MFILFIDKSDRIEKSNIEPFVDLSTKSKHWRVLFNSSFFNYLERYNELEKSRREYEETNNRLKTLNDQLEKDLLNVGRSGTLLRREPEVKEKILCIKNDFSFV